MSEQQNYGFGKFVPGFDFLQNLAKGSSHAAMPNLSNWVAPTLNVEELEKRIGELKAVSFWLDQNAKALAATIQALELQKMTLATLKGMNFNMGELAQAMKVGTSPGAASSGEAPDGSAASAGATASMADAAQAAVAKARARKKNAGADAAPGAGAKAAGVVDPLQWWGALTEQFQEIAAGALREAAKQPAVEAAREIASGITQQAMRAANDMAGAGGSRAGAKSAAKAAAPARKAAAPRKSEATKKGSRKPGSRRT